MFCVRRPKGLSKGGWRPTQRDGAQHAQHAHAIDRLRTRSSCACKLRDTHPELRIAILDLSKRHAIASRRRQAPKRGIDCCCGSNAVSGRIATAWPPFCFQHLGRHWASLRGTCSGAPACTLPLPRHPVSCGSVPAPECASRHFIQYACSERGARAARAGWGCLGQCTARGVARQGGTAPMRVWGAPIPLAQTP